MVGSGKRAGFGGGQGRLLICTIVLNILKLNNFNFPFFLFTFMWNLILENVRSPKIKLKVGGSESQRLI